MVFFFFLRIISNRPNVGLELKTKSRMLYQLSLPGAPTQKSTKCIMSVCHPC